MTILNTGINGIRTLVAPYISEGDWGTGTADVLVSDTDLEAEITGIEQPVSYTLADKTISMNSSLPSTAGTGNVITEHVKRLSTGDVLLRTTFTGVTTNSTKSIHNIDTLVFIPLQ